MTAVGLGRWLAGLLGAALLVGAAQAATPTFPALTGRVVDAAGVLSPQVETDLTARLQTLETQTGRQLVVVTVPSLQDYPIEDFGYQLGRAWGIGQKGLDNGALFLVAPAEHQVRIEVGYGLEPVLTDALSSVILQRSVLPRFRAGDIAGGVVDGTAALIGQLSLPDDAAKANVAAAAQPAPRGGGSLIPVIILLVVLFLVFSRIFGGGRRGGLGWLLPMLLMGGRGGGGGFGGGSFGGGGGGFSGGGGSFGGGGSSGRW